MVSKTGFTNWNAKIAILRASMVVTYYIKLFRTGADRHNGILIPLLLLVAEDNKYRVLITSQDSQQMFLNSHLGILWRL